MEAIATRGLTKRFSRFSFGGLKFNAPGHGPISLNVRRDEVLALDHLDLSVESGSVYGILGPNGSGKSTTMKLILGLIRATSGSAHIFGQPCDRIESRLHVGFLPENPYFYPYLTGEETLWFYGQISGLTKSDLRRRVPELLDLVGLAEAKDRALAGYSKGMLQRIGLAQALVHDPRLLLLDEPTAGVDPIGSREMRDLILDLKARGKTILLSSHLLEQAQDVCDRVCILHRGHKVLDGKLADLITDSERLNVVIRGLPGPAHAPLRAFVEKQGAHVVSMGHPQTTLESLFLDAVKDGEARRGKSPEANQSHE